MAYSYVKINGQRVEKNVAAAFEKMRAAFKKQFSLDLLVTSGTRTAAEQKRLRDAYLAGKGGLAAPVGFSNHEESGPRGPRALDLRDSGSDAGVTRAGSTRAKWLRANSSKFGFSPAGYGFSQIEPWHYEFTGKIGAVPAPKPNTSGTSGAPITDTSREDDMILFIQGKAGARRGGLYYIAGGTASFLGAHRGSGFPTLTDESEIKELQKRVSGIG